MSSKIRKRVGCDKEVKRLIDLAQRNHWSVEMTEGHHIRFIPTDKNCPQVIHSLTASDWRAHANLKSRLRRSGLRIPRSGE